MRLGRPLGLGDPIAEGPDIVAVVDIRTICWSLVENHDAWVITNARLSDIQSYCFVTVNVDCTVMVMHSP